MSTWHEKTVGRIGGVGTIGACLLLAAIAQGQEKPAMAEQAFKSVRVLKGIPVDQFTASLGFFSASLGATCIDCHSSESGGSWAKYAYFSGKREITCYSCYRGVEWPA
jgi:hypothetical protein